MTCQLVLTEFFLHNPAQLNKFNSTFAAGGWLVDVDLQFSHKIFLLAAIIFMHAHRS
jgi:hypothetical protein